MKTINASSTTDVYLRSLAEFLLEVYGSKKMKNEKGKRRQEDKK